MRVDIEQFRSASDSLYSATGLFERMLDVIADRIFQTHGRGTSFSVSAIRFTRMETAWWSHSNFDCESSSSAEQGGSVDDSSEFADVSGPVVLREQRSILPGDLEPLQSEVYGCTIRKVLCKFLEILSSLSEWRYDQWKDRESVPQILSELPCLHHLGEIPMSCRDDSYINTDRILPTNSLKNAFLHDTKQSNLCCERELADFIQKERSIIGSFKPTVPSLGCTGEGTLLVPKQLGIDQIRGNSTAVHPEKGTFGSCRSLVDRTGDDFLTRSGFAQDEHRHRRGSNDDDSLHDTLEPIMGTNDLFIERLPSQSIERGLSVGFGSTPEGLQLMEATRCIKRHCQRLKCRCDQERVCSIELRIVLQCPDNEPFRLFISDQSTAYDRSVPCECCGKGAKQTPARANGVQQRQTTSIHPASNPL
mgnify:CR=1 FL=1